MCCTGDYAKLLLPTWKQTGKDTDINNHLIEIQIFKITQFIIQNHPVMKNITVILTIFFFSISFTGYAQINLKEKLKKTINSIDQRTDQGIEKGLDAVQEGIEKKLSKKDSDGQPAEDQNQQQAEQPQQEQAEEIQDASAPAEQPVMETYSKFDFIPGEKVIFFEDFSQDAVGDFPALWNTNGSAEVVTTSLFPGKWMKFSGNKSIWTDQLLALPDNYTIEFDVIPIKGDNDNMAGYDFRLIQSIHEKAFDWGAVPGKSGFLFSVEYFGRPGYRTYINAEDGGEFGMSGTYENEKCKQFENKMYHISIWMQKSRIRLYQNETKLFDLPKAFPLPGIKMDRIRFEEGAALVSNIRIAVGAPDTRNKLITEGRLVTYGIYFDVSKDIVKPESHGTLKDIATVLTENPGIRVSIVGHTDSDGDDASNMDLSKRRGAAVKEALVKSFGIEASRLETDGMGESMPVAANDTPVNKALNRRVEFIKL